MEVEHRGQVSLKSLSAKERSALEAVAAIEDLEPADYTIWGDACRCVTTMEDGTEVDLTDGPSPTVRNDRPHQLGDDRVCA
jgi:hypothetical protein